MLNRWSALALVLVFAVTAEAQRTGRPSVADNWKRRLGDSAALLKSGDHAASLKITERLIREMIDQLGRGDGAMQIFGIAVTQKALALAGLGREDDALWYWHTVVTLYPAFAKSDLSAFGEAGAFLDRHRVPPPLNENERQVRIAEKDPRIQPPKIRRRAEPEFASGALAFGTSGLIIVECLITTEGKIATPRVLQPLPAPTLTYTVLEALRKWRFEPGRLDGRPVNVIFKLTVNFKL